MPPALRTARWLLLLTVPLSLAVLVLKLTGALDVLAVIFRPLFGLLGLPGEAAVVFATACLLNIYSCIAVIETLGLTGRAVTILALMCLISHNLPVESAVQKKASSAAWRMIVLRLGASFLAGFALSVLLPADPSAGVEVERAAASAAGAGVGAELRLWLAGISRLCVKILVLVTVLMIFERILDEFGITRRLAVVMKYPLRLLGLPPSTAFLWVVANTLGLAYGAGVLLDHRRRGLISRADADLLNHHVAISHSLLEDTLLFAALGVPVVWITLPRLLLAGAAVWWRRLMPGLAEDPGCVGAGAREKVA